METGKVAAESVSVSEVPGMGSLPEFGRTLLPLNIPTLWFYCCNNCPRIAALASLQIPVENGNQTRGSMLLCIDCRRLYRKWSMRQVHGSS